MLLSQLRAAPTPAGRPLLVAPHVFHCACKMVDKHLHACVTERMSMTFSAPALCCMPVSRANATSNLHLPPFNPIVWVQVAAGAAVSASHVALMPDASTKQAACYVCVFAALLPRALRACKRMLCGHQQRVTPFVVAIQFFHQESGQLVVVLSDGHACRYLHTICAGWSAC